MEFSPMNARNVLNICKSIMGYDTLWIKEQKPYDHFTRCRKKFLTKFSLIIKILWKVGIEGTYISQRNKEHI